MEVMLPVSFLLQLDEPRRDFWTARSKPKCSDGDVIMGRLMRKDTGAVEVLLYLRSASNHGGETVSRWLREEAVGVHRQLRATPAARPIIVNPRWVCIDCAELELRRRQSLK
jgi:hypothetical protein